MGIQMRAPSKEWAEQEGDEREYRQGIIEALQHLKIYCHALFIYFVALYPGGCTVNICREPNPARETPGTQKMTVPGSRGAECN